MIVLANVDGMRAALAAVSSVVPARSPKPVLQSVLLTANENDVTLTANDLEVSIVYHVSGVQVDQPGRVLLPYAKFREIVSRVHCLDIAIELAGDKILIKTDKGKFNLPSEDPDTFPVAVPFSSANYQVCDSKSLGMAIERTEFATDPNSTRFALAGVQFLLQPDSLGLVATDARRLASQPVAGVTTHGDIEAISEVVSLKTLKAMQKVLGDGTVHLYMTGNSIHFRTDRAVIYGRLVEGRFPSYSDVIPSNRKTTFSVKARDFLDALNQAAVTTSEESRGLLCKFFADGRALISSKTEIGNSEIELQVEWASGACDTQVTFDYRLIADGVAKMDGTIQMALQGEKGAGLITDDAGYEYVVMPLTKEA